MSTPGSSAAHRRPRRRPAVPSAQGVGATPGCVRRRGRLAEMLLEEGRLDEAEGLLRGILSYVESTQVCVCGGWVGWVWVWVEW